MDGDRWIRAKGSNTTAIGLTLIMACGVAYADTDGARDRAAELREIREQIESVKRRIDRETRRRGSAENELRETELAIGQAGRKLATIREERLASQQRRDQLQRRQSQLETELGSERSGLAEQLRLAYLNGRQERLKLVLNQQDPARLGRLMVYYAYLGDMRAGKIAEVNEKLGDLLSVIRSVDAETRRLGELEAQQSQELAALEQSRQRRSEIVIELQRSIATQDARLHKLRADAKALEDLIAEIQRALAALPVDGQEPIAQWRGKLVWPIQGQLLVDFGQPQADGGLKSNGVLIAARSGSEVHALYHGRVAYADWLPGMGLLAVVEHGDGYMSLYGHNEALFKSVGEWVQSGEVIASVGDSGGQSQSALYFEIRHETRPVNPHRWIGRRLARP